VGDETCSGRKSQKGRGEKTRGGRWWQKADSKIPGPQIERIGWDAAGEKRVRGKCGGRNGRIQGSNESEKLLGTKTSLEKDIIYDRKGEEITKEEVTLIPREEGEKGGKKQMLRRD